MQFEPNKDMPHFTIPGVMPSLNEYLAACNRNPHVGAKMKRENTNIACLCIRSGLKRWNAKNKIILHYHIYEPNMKRDHDNVLSTTCKFVQDALIKTGVIENDGWKNIENFTHDWFIDKVNPRTEVWIEVIGG